MVQKEKMSNDEIRERIAEVEFEIDLEEAKISDCNDAISGCKKELERLRGLLNE